MEGAFKFFLQIFNDTFLFGSSNRLFKFLLISLSRMMNFRKFNIDLFCLIIIFDAMQDNGDP